MNPLYKNYHIQKKASMIYETLSAERVCRRNSVKIIEICENADYDFKTSDGLTYEVKADSMSLKTGNFFIEFIGYGQPSGISISKSNYYILSDTEKYYLIETDKLKLLVENCITRKTADGSTFGYLISRKIIIENSVCI